MKKKQKGLTNAYNDVVKARHRLIGLSKKKYLYEINFLGNLAGRIKAELLKDTPEKIDELKSQNKEYGYLKK